MTDSITLDFRPLVIWGFDRDFFDYLNNLDIKYKTWSAVKVLISENDFNLLRLTNKYTFIECQQQHPSGFSGLSITAYKIMLNYDK